MMLPIIILAGGLATRLRPMTETIPKALVLIKGEPFIAHQLRLLQRHGFTKIILCLGYLGEQIQAFVGDGSRFGMQITYIFDGPQLLGTGGAIKRALPCLEQDAFFVLYGDSYLPCDYAAVQTAFVASSQKALMTVFCNNGSWDTSNVEFANGKILAYDKQNRTPRMHYIDYGLGILTQALFADLAESTYCDLAHIYQKLLQQQQLAAYEVSQRFYENGSFTGIAELETYL